MFFINNATDITSYVEGKTPQGAEKNQYELEKNYKNHQRNFLNGFMKMV